MKSHTKLTIKIYWQHIRRYRLAAGLVMVVTILSTALDLVLPIFYKEFFNLMVAPGAAAEKAGALLQILYLVIIVFGFSWVLHRVAGFTANYWVSQVMADLANTCFAYLHQHSFAFFHSNFVGSLVKRANRFYQAFLSLHAIMLWEIVPLLTRVAVVTIVLFTQNASLGWIMAGWISIFTLVSYGISQVLFKYYLRRSELDSQVTGYLADTITNQSNVKLFVGQRRERTGFGAVTDARRQAQKLTWDLSVLSEGLQAALMIGLEFAMIYVAINLWVAGRLSLGDMVLIQTYLFTMFDTFWNLGRYIRDIYDQLADAAEMTQIFNTPHEIQDRLKAKSLEVKRGGVFFDDAGFYYHKTRPIISHFNLTIKPSEKVALVGPSGAGKSTIIKLLLRIHDLTEGKILIDNQNISHVTQDSLHANISLVPQDPILFHRTLRENIRYGRPAATDKEVIKAARLAHSHEFISDFPEGYETYVGERGVKLSGGERQRVAIARAILRDAPILVLDEATSSLDSESERLIQDALEHLMRRKTVIVIAHRLSTIMKMDRILVIDNGQIVEAGAHHELVAKRSGLYRNLWQVQAGGFIQ